MHLILFFMNSLHTYFCLLCFILSFLQTPQIRLVSLSTIFICMWLHSVIRLCLFVSGMHSHMLPLHLIGLVEVKYPWFCMKN